MSWSTRKTPLISGSLLILFTLTILFQRFKDNSGYFNPSEIFGFLVILAVMTSGAFILLKLLLRDGVMSSLLAGLFSYLFFNGHRLFVLYEKKIIPEEYFNGELYHELTTFLVLALLAIVIFVLTIRGLKRYRGITVVFFLLFLLINLTVESAIAFLRAPAMTSGPVVIREKPGQINAKHPNIYYIILDSYTSPASLEKYWQHTDPALETTLDFLRVNYSRSASTRFISTPFCLSSYLNMQWEKADDQGDLRSMYRSLGNLRNNAVVSFLKEHRYRLRNLSLFLVDRELPAYKYFPEVNIWGNSLFFLGYRAVRRVHRTPFEIRTNFHIASEVMNQAAENSTADDPVFTYAHLMLPHSRYLVGEDGQMQRNPGLPDKEKYLEQLKFARKTMIFFFSSLIRKDPGSVIIIQGDHGFRDLEREEDRKEEAHTVFNSLYLSGDKIPDETKGCLNNPVNNFRIVFNKYFGTEMELEPGN